MKASPEKRLPRNSLVPERVIKPPGNFLDQIGRHDLENLLTPTSPWAFFSAEVYDPTFGTRGAGGLGVLARDFTRLAEQYDIPFVTITPFYSKWWEQAIDANLQQKVSWHHAHEKDADGFKHLPKDYGYKKAQVTISLKVNGEDNRGIEIWKKGHRMVLFAPDLAEVYFGSAQSDHRLYQEMVGGFAGMKVLEQFGIDPPVIHLNEGSSVFAAIAYMDKLMSGSGGVSLKEALALTQAKTLMTNHTLVPAAWNRFSLGQLEKYVFPNLTETSGKLKDYLTGFMKTFPQDERRKEEKLLDLGLLALEVSGKLNGVSVSHAAIAGSKFKKSDGSGVSFEPITNGIDMDTWVDRQILSYLKKQGVYDGWNLPAGNFEEAIDVLSVDNLWMEKQNAKRKLISFLNARQRKTQHGEVVVIPKEAKIAVWPRRFADYKRPGMMLRDKERLARILETNNTYLIMAGRAHPDDKAMQDEIRNVLRIVNSHDILKKRVIFIQDYDTSLANYLNSGADVGVNTPIVGNEACGTSIFKQAGNLTVLVSTRDGGLADAPEGSFLEITGKTDSEEELDSLYAQFEYALSLIGYDNREAWADRVRTQLAGLGRKVSGTRMMKEYIDFVLPRLEPST